MTAKAPIIVIKKKGGHGGHHGGAWKVAYADFVTAMMALFIVLWLMNSSQKIQKAVGGYFKDPTGKSEKIGSDMVGAKDNFVVSKDNMEQLKKQLQAAMKKVPDFDKLKNQVQITAEEDGLRIELLEQPGGTFFKLGSAQPTSALRDFLKAISPELGKLGNQVSIEGHTDSVPYSDDRLYSNWELSTDRANAARRLMQGNGIAQGQVAEVRGFADQLLRRPDHPDDPSNRRITLIVAPNALPAMSGESGQVPPATQIVQPGAVKNTVAETSKRK